MNIDYIEKTNAVHLVIYDMEVGLERVRPNIEEIRTATALTVTIYEWDIDDPKEVWYVCARLLKDNLPGITALQIFCDARRAVFGELLLKQFPAIRSLTLHSLDNPAIYQAIAGLKELTQLSLDYDRTEGAESLSLSTCEVLADALEDLPCLRKLKCSIWTFEDRRECLKPLFVAFDGRVEVEIEGVLEEDLGEILKNGGTFDQAMERKCRRFKLPFPLEYVVEEEEEEEDIQPWVEALISAKNLERWDVFHSLFCQLPKVTWLGSKYWETSDPKERIPWARVSQHTGNIPTL